MKTKNFDYFKIMNETEAKNHDSSCYHSFSFLLFFTMPKPSGFGLDSRLRSRIREYVDSPDTQVPTETGAYEFLTQVSPEYVLLFATPFYWVTNTIDTKESLKVYY